MKECYWLGGQKDILFGKSFFEALPTTNFATWLFWKGAEEKDVGERQLLLAACDTVAYAMKSLPKIPAHEQAALKRALDFTYGFISPEGVKISRYDIRQKLSDTWDLGLKHYDTNNCSVGWVLAGLNLLVRIVTGESPYDDIWLIPCICGGGAGYAACRKEGRDLHRTSEWEKANLKFQKVSSGFVRNRILK